MGRRPELRDLTDQGVRDWMAPRRAAWRVAVENNGIDGSVGAIVRAHNAFAGGGIQLLGRSRYNKRAAVGTHQHEPIRVLDAVEGAFVVSVEADCTLPPLPLDLWSGATYVLGHDAVGLSPALAARCDARFGPPPGWSAATSPAMLAHLLMSRLRHGAPRAGATSGGAPASALSVAGDEPPGSIRRRAGREPDGEYPPRASVADDEPPGSIRRRAGREPDGSPAWQADWPGLTRAEQRARLGFGWWVERFAWTVRRDWWIHLPHAQTPLNAVAAARNALAAGAAQIITPDDPGPQRAPLGDHWRVASLRDVVAWARAEGYPLVALEQGGTPLADAELPASAVLVAGHEIHGLSPEELRACEGIVSLPQWGSVNSLNVASAVGLLLDHAPRSAECP